MMTRQVFAVLLSLAAVPALAGEDPTPFYKTPYASSATGDRPGTEKGGAKATPDEAVGFYRTPYAVVHSRGATTPEKQRDDAASPRLCTCQRD